MIGQVIIDALYLTVKYPYADIFERWNRYAEGVDHRKLSQGLPIGDFVVSTGSSGYKISVRQHDARIFLTPDVDQKRGEGQGMGIWVQLGPKFLIANGPRLHTAVKELLLSIGVQGDYETRITRIDIAMDLFGVDIKDLDLETKRKNWVGRSKIKKHIFNSRTEDLETIYIGSRKSAVYVRIYDKRAEAIQDNDIQFWLDVWGGVSDAVTRVEWEVKPNKGKFAKDLQDFALFNGFSARELLVYLLDWGRLAEPDLSNKNRSRWTDSEFWQELREVAAQWADGVDWPTTRFGKTIKPMSEAYAKQAAGGLAGAMARSNPDNPNLSDMFDQLEDFGISFGDIERKAQEKAELIKRL